LQVLLAARPAAWGAATGTAAGRTGRRRWFRSREQQQQQLLGHIVIRQGEAGFIEATGQQVKPAGIEGPACGSGSLGLFEHGA